MGNTLNSRKKKKKKRGKYYHRMPKILQMFNLAQNSNCQKITGHA